MKAHDWLDYIRLIKDKLIQQFILSSKGEYGMRKTRRMVAGVILLAFVMSLTMLVPAFAEENFTVHAKAPSAWTEPGLWAWSAPDGTNVFAAWPGEKLVKDENNEGWFSYAIPTWANSIIVNEGVDGGGQTSDVSIEGKELWITIADDFTTTLVYEAPEGFQAATAETAVTEDTAAPKTGEVSMAYIWITIAAISGIGYTVLKRKKIA